MKINLEYCDHYYKELYTEVKGEAFFILSGKPKCNFCKYCNLNLGNR